MELTELINDSYWTAVEKGHFDEEPSFGELIALAHGELSEAHEARRLRDFETWYRESDGKPEGVQFELADAVLRIFNMSRHLGIDIEAAMLEKHAFNKTRPYKHGKRH